jgi:hypothetical protein
MLCYPLDKCTNMAREWNRTTLWLPSGTAEPPSRFQISVGQAKGETVWAFSIGMVWEFQKIMFRRTCVSDALQMVDLYHARQHLWEVARKLYPNDEGKQKAWMKIHQKRLLDRGKIEKLVGALRSIESDNPEVTEKIRTEADYFERNAERMRYPKFRGQHLFIGSGVIEAGCKTVVAFRLTFEEPTRSWLSAAAF